MLFTLRPAAKRANLTERSIRHLFEHGVMTAVRQGGQGNALWFSPSEIVVGRICGDLMHLGANLVELKSLAETIRAGNVSASERQVFFKVTPHENGVPMRGEFEFGRLSMPTNRIIVYNVSLIFAEAIKDNRKFVRENFKPTTCIKQRQSITAILETHNADEVVAFFTEAARYAAAGDKW